MKIPESMREELDAWNNGSGIDLEGWISCQGNFSLAVGYSTIFNPKFVLFEDYILVGEEVCEKLITAVRTWEGQIESTRKGVEWIINHEHIADLHYLGCEDLSKDKIVYLGEALKEIYEAKLAYQFPERPCTVEFYKPEDEEDLREYQLSFWQKKHETENV